MISRTTLGKLFSDDFNRANGAVGNGWVAHLGTWAIDTNQLKATDSLFGYMSLEQPLGAAYNEMVTQVRWKRSSNFTRPGLYTKQDFATKRGYSAEWGAIHADGVQTQYENGGDPVQIAEITGVAFAFNTYYQAKLHTKDGVQKLWIDGVLQLNNTSTQWDGTSYSSTGLLRGDGGDNTAVFYEDFAAYAKVGTAGANSVVVSGLGAGYKIRVGGKTAVESGSGTATLDLAELTMPQTTLDILDPSNAVVESINPASGGVWGGDVYTYAETAPSAPAAFVNPVGGETFDAGTTVQWTAATDPEGDTLHYHGQYSTDGGGTWNTLFGLQLGLTYAWDTSAIADSANCKVRIFANDGVFDGPALTSNVFAIYHNTAPSTPGAFVVPVSGAMYGTTLPAEWGASTDPEGDPVEYYGELSLDNGGTWAEAFTWQSGLTNDIDITGLVYTEQALLRVKARDEPFHLESAWRTSAAFTVFSISQPPAAPTVDLLIVGDYSILIGVSGFSDPDVGDTHRASRYVLALEAGSFGSPLIDTGWDVAGKEKRWLTGLQTGTDFKLQVTVQDQGGQPSTATVKHFRSRRVIALGSAAGFDQDRNEGTDATIQGQYGELIPGVGFVPSRYPELTFPLGAAAGLVADRGIRMRMANVNEDYSQSGLPTSSTQAIKYTSAAFNAPDGPFSFMLIIRPERVLDLPWQDVLQGAYEILGSNGDHWWLYQRDGALGIGPPVADTITPHENAHPLGFGPNFYFGDIVSDVPYLVFFTFLREVADPTCLSIAGAPHAGRVTTPGIACSWLNGVRRAHGHLRGDGDFPSSGGSCAPGEDQYLPTAPSFETDDNILWLGRHSGDGNRNFDQSANGIAYPGIASDLTFWDRLITDAEVAHVQEAFARGDMEAVVQRVRFMAPIMDDDLNQPLPPEKPVGDVVVL